MHARCPHARETRQAQRRWRSRHWLPCSPKFFFSISTCTTGCVFSMRKGPSLRPRARATVEAPAPQRVTLLTSHIRNGGESTPHVCNICLNQMQAWSDRTPDWIQAPCCKEVWHEGCILRYARDLASDTIGCPQCKTTHEATDVANWDAWEVLERLFPEREYAPSDDELYDSAGQSDDDDDDDDNDDDDDIDAAQTLPTARRTRSQGAPEVPTRRTRSSGVYM